MNIKQLAESIASDYRKFAVNSNVSVSEELNGFKIKEALSTGKTGIMIYLDGNYNREGISFNNGWDIDENYLGEACDVIAGILNKYNVPLGIDGQSIIAHSKSY